VVHVHGMCGNFYHNKFVPNFFNAYSAYGISCLFVNHSGHDYIAESMHGDQAEFLGGSIVDQSSIDADLVAIILWARDSGYESLVLQGHSYGCDIVVRNLETLPWVPVGLVLISPADSLEVHQNYLGAESAEEQALRLRSTSGHERDRIQLLDESECGVAAEDIRYPIPMTRRALLSFLDRGPGVFHYGPGDASEIRRFDARAIVYLGNRDPLLFDRQMQAHDVLSAMFKEIVWTEENQGDHHMTGIEDDVAKEFARWVHQRGMP
jgi:pimeloyl-ACP methyl ester carboxylesterase